MSDVLNIMQLVGILTSVWTMDHFGRRRLLLIGAVFMFICHVITAVLCGKYASNWAEHKTKSWVSVAFMLVFMVFFGASWGPVGWAVPAEVFPSSLRAKGVAFAVFLNWVSNFIIVSSLLIIVYYEKGCVEETNPHIRVSSLPCSATRATTPLTHSLPSSAWEPLSSPSFACPRPTVAHWRTWMLSLATTPLLRMGSTRCLSSSKFARRRR